MKIDSSEIAPSGERALKFRVGGNELLILRGLVQAAMQHFPRIRHTEVTYQRLQAMSRCLASPEIDEWAARQDLNNQARDIEQKLFTGHTKFSDSGIKWEKNQITFNNPNGQGRDFTLSREQMESYWPILSLWMDHKFDELSNNTINGSIF